jgi:hypothetical protein
MVIYIGNQKGIKIMTTINMNTTIAQIMDLQKTDPEGLLDAVEDQIASLEGEGKLHWDKQLFLTNLRSLYNTLMEG